MADRVPISSTVADAIVAELRRQHPTECHYEHVFGERDCDVYRPDGSLLFAFRTQRLLAADLKRWLRPLTRVAKETHRRADAQGSNSVFNNGVAGFLNGSAVAFNRDRPSDWRALESLMRALDAVYRELPQYAVVAGAVKDTPPELVIPCTAFTTLTANLCATGIHTDGNNLEGGYGVMTAIRSRDFRGGLFVLPKFRVAVDLRSGDVLVVDNREYHGNTPFESGWRVSAIAYYHESNRAR